MNKSMIKKISCMALAGCMLLSGQALATDSRAELQNQLQQSTIGTIISDKTLGYGARYDLRKYKYITIDEVGDTNANWAVAAAKLFEFSSKTSIPISAKHLDYSTAYNSVTEGNANSHNRNLGTVANMKVALGYLTSGRGPVAKQDFEWDGKLTAVSNSTLTSKNKVNTLESYKIFPSVYKTTYDIGNGEVVTSGFNDPYIYTTTENQTGSKFSATKSITSYTGGEIEQIREDIKEHIINYGAVSAKIYKNGTDYYNYRIGDGETHDVYWEYDGSSMYSYSYRMWTPRDTISYYCSGKNLTPNHDVIIIGWDDELEVPGAPGKGAYIVLDPESFYTQYYAHWSTSGNRKRDPFIWEGKTRWFLYDKTTVDTNYYYVSYYDYYIESEVYGIKDMSMTSYNKTYQHDPLGMSTSINAVNHSPIGYGANVFNRNSATPETLSAVSIACETDMQYEIYVNPKSGELTSDKLIKVATTDVLEAGYNTIHLDKTVVLTGEKFAIAVKYITPSNYTTATVARIGVEAPKQEMYYMVGKNKTEVRYDNIPFWYGKVTSSQGQSFIGSSLDSWTDLYSQSTTKNVNICIKAYVRENPEYKIPAEKVEIKQRTQDAFGDIIEQDITETLKVIKGDSVSLGAVVSPSDAADKAISWSSSNKSIATVDKEGVVTTHSAGVVTITARLTNAPTIFATCKIDVRVPVESFNLNKNNVTILAGDTNVLAAIIGPEDATTTKVEWSSNNSEVVKVTEDGLLIGLKQGTAIVTGVLRDENGVHTATCKVTVPVSLVVDVTGISLNKTSIQLLKGTRETLTATLTPSDATNTALVWTSSDKTVAIVNSNGRITALSPGTATITATAVSGGESATCKVTVIEEAVVKATGVKLNTSTIALERDQTSQLVATLQPTNTADQTVTWSSSDLDVAEVDSNGRITAIAPGTATITVKTNDGGYTASCTVTVVKPRIPVTGITLNQTLITLDKGTLAQIIASTEPANADNTKIKWASSNTNIATVDENGIVTAVGFGDATITATTDDGGYTKKCVISVPEIIAVTGIELSSTELTIEKGITAELEIKVLPTNATNTNVTCEITDEKIAKLGGDGVKALAVGKTTITFKTQEGEYTATCTINVIEPTKEITINSGNYQINEDNKIYDVPSDTTASEFKENIVTNGTNIIITDKNGNEIKEDGLVGNGSTITISKEVTTTPEEGGDPVTTTVTETYIVRVDGDLNGDGTISVTDFGQMKEYIIGTRQLNELELEAGDLNQDGKVTLTDLSIIKQQIISDEEVQQ